MCAIKRHLEKRAEESSCRCVPGFLIGQFNSGKNIALALNVFDRSPWRCREVEYGPQPRKTGFKYLQNHTVGRTRVNRNLPSCV
jgi:hypothetical protein